MNLGQSLRALLRHPFLRFAAVGAAGFVLDEAVLTILHYVFGVDAYAARAVSIVVAMTFTWWGNRNLTFAEQAARGDAGAVFQEWMKFVAANAVGAVVNYATYSLLIAVAPEPLGHPLVATAIGVGVGLIFNFTLSKRFVFRA
ncbi:MAG: GtrA family protein [Alphaproteobacteria bacterium]|nr:GtrA family protein [Alphaproteobacteria bacterium]MBV9420456.1 GtrA family protein [Alphaproteobacteria bacterium]MBV9903735.1 GtrA family protein [Alphaproteobacteria bacterium]